MRASERERTQYSGIPRRAYKRRLTVRSWWSDSCSTSTIRKREPGVRLAVVPPRVGDDGDVGLRLRAVVQGQRPASAHPELEAAEHLGEALGHQRNSDGVLASLGRSGAQVSVEQNSASASNAPVSTARFELGPAQTELLPIGIGMVGCAIGRVWPAPVTGRVTRSPSP